jgi:uncharacterized membrane protein
MKHMKIALVASIVYLLLGNIVGVQSEEFPCSDFIKVLFAPYTFIAGMSSFAGWDWLSLVMEAIIFVMTIPIFLLVVVVVGHIKNWLTERSRKKSACNID